jgi:hypothetical protein
MFTATELASVLKSNVRDVLRKARAPRLGGKLRTTGRGEIGITRRHASNMPSEGLYISKPWVRREAYTLLSKQGFFSPFWMAAASH